MSINVEPTASEKVNILPKEQSISEEVLSNPSRVAIATITYYPIWRQGGTIEENIDQLRGNLALETIAAATENGYQVVVVDSGSTQSFIDTARSLGARVSAQEEKHMSGARRQAIRESAAQTGVEVICITEPEKISLVRDLIPAVAQPILEGKADIVIPERTSYSYSTYPEEQAKFEQKSNRLFSRLAQIAGLIKPDAPELDMFMGPRIIRNEPGLIKLFMERYAFEPGEAKTHSLVNTEAWANTLFFPVLTALKKGLTVSSIKVDYTHPPEQTASEIDNPDFNYKRRMQSRGILTAVIHYLKASKDQQSRLSKLE